MFASAGSWAARHRWWVVIATLAFVVGGGVWGAGVFGALTGGAGFDPPEAESTYADGLLAGPLGRETADLIVLYESDEYTVDDPAFAEPVQEALGAVPPDAVTRMDSYWSTGDETLVSDDRAATVVTVQLPSDDDEQERVAQYLEIRDELDVPGLTVSYGGLAAMTEQVNALASQDLVRAEALSLPLLLVLLVLIFRSAVAALLPLAVGVVAAVGSLSVLRVLSFGLEISTFSINVITLLGLGLAIDYALFVVSRFREELARGVPVDAAVARTMATAGRTVVFSAVTVAISFSSLVLFPSRFLSSMGYAGTLTVLFAALAALTVLPALLSFTGHRVNALRIPLPGRRRAGVAADETRGGWYRTAHAVMRRPVLATVAITALLLGLGLPMLGVNWARPGDWVLPAEAQARVVTEQLESRFEVDPGKIVTVAVEMPGAADTPQARGELEDYARRLEQVDGIHGAAVTGTHENLARVTLGYTMDPMSPEAMRMVRDVRAQEPPQGAEAFATNMPASRVDIIDMVTERLPLMAVFITVVSFVVLFMAFGSVTLPLKSVVMNLLSLSAAFGAITLVFQYGFLSDLLGFVPVGAVDINFPVLIVAIAFGLAVDYEVFLLSRIREHWVRTGDHAEAIAVGVQRTAGIITAAALLMVVVVGGFVTSSIIFMQMIGVGLVIAIVVDATIVRGLLAPASMRLLGRWAWWAPAPMARWWARYGIREGEEEAEPAAPRAAAAVVPVDSSSV